MEKEVYDRSIITGELQLSFWSGLTHFGLVLFLLIIPATILFVNLIQYFDSGSISFREKEVWIFVIPSALAPIVYLLQKRRLKFRTIKTRLNHLQLKENLIQVAKQLEWIFISATPTAYVAITNPRFISGSWGEQITIIFSENTVLINSICDPQKRSSVVSWGRNRKNEETFINKIIEAEHQLAQETPFPLS